MFNLHLRIQTLSAPNLMTVYTVWLINKSGGLAYHRTINEGFHPKLTANDYLVLASTFQR